MVFHVKMSRSAIESKTLREYAEPHLKYIAMSALATISPEPIPSFIATL
uniref:Uncharacterized protein n=1 Tax=Arundo donax TaxID=35708 RepID=A0A0A9HF72_ARUDO